MRLHWSSLLSPARRVLRRKLRVGRRRGHPDFAQVSRQVRGQLAAALPSLEFLFMNISKSIEPLSNGSQRLVDECEILLHLASGRENGQNLMQDTLKILEGPLSYIDLCLRHRERLITLLSSCERQADAMLQARNAMHATHAPLAYLTVLFKIESARLPPDMRDTFLTVTAEIERMRHLVNETFEQNATRLAEVQKTLSAVRQQLEGYFSKHANDIIAKRGQIDRAIQTLNDQLTHNDERDLRMHNQSRLIANQVGQIVQNLQFQDIIQQKCSHVISALESPSFIDNPTQARLQSCQLDATVADLDQGALQIRSSLDGIVHETDRFDEICLKLEGLEGMVASADGMVQLLLESLSEVGEITRAISTLTESANHALAPMHDLAATLSSTVVELSIDMRLIALNAQIRSVQGGVGTGLETLAARTAEISTATTTLTTENSVELKTLRENLNEMITSFQDLKDRGDQSLADFTNGSSDIETRLHAMRDKTLTAFTAISGTIAAVRTHTSDIAASLDRVPEHRRNLDAPARLLHTLYAHQPAGEITDTPPSTHTYTMASEHIVHATLFGTANQSSAASPSCPTAAISPVKTADLGENAELF